MSMARPSAEERFSASFDKTETCWLWTRHKDDAGYGVFFAHGKFYKAHRYSYEMSHGAIPPGYQIDHLCRVRECVRPAHLEAVTPAVNNIRSFGPSALNARKTHCVRGHEYDRISASRQWRKCSRCERERAIRRGLARPDSPLGLVGVPKGQRPCSGCPGVVGADRRADAVYCSDKCRTQTHRRRRAVAS